MTFYYTEKREFSVETVEKPPVPAVPVIPIIIAAATLALLGGAIALRAIRT